MSVRAMKAGAVEFLTKPFDADDLLNAIQQAVSGTHSEELETTRALTEIVGESRALRRSEAVSRSWHRPIPRS